MVSTTDNLGILLHDATRLVRKRLDRRIAHLGLSTAQWRLLVGTLRSGSATQARLAEKLEIEPISVSRLIDRMEQGGWLHREAHPDDRRARIVVATDKARRIGPEAKAIVNALYDEALAGLSDDDRCVLQAALVKISENLKAPDPSKESEALPTPFETQT